MTDVLTWIKAHLLIVLFCAVIVIAYPVGWFISSAQNSSVQDSIQSRVRSFETSLRSVENVSVTIKPLTPGVNEFDRNMVINDDVLNEYRTYREAIKRDADTIIHEAIAINRAGHQDQLVPGLLPAPAPGLENDLPYKIHDAYVNAHVELLKDLNAGKPILDADLATTLDDFRNTFIRTQLNLESNANLTDEELERLREAMTARRLLEYRQHAEEISLYVDDVNSVFKVKPWDSARGKPTPGQWFDWQHEYWVKADIVDAINKANSLERTDGELNPISGPTSSVVKRIISLEVLPMFSIQKKKAEEDPGFFGGEGEVFGFEGQAVGEGATLGKGGGKMLDEYGEAGGRGRGSSGKSTVSNDDPTKPFESDFSESISGRTSNPLYDVRKVNLGVIVDSSRLPALINAIQHTNFMTVVGCSVQQIDPISEMAMGYFYGGDPVVRADLAIETLWFRDWTTSLMPDDVKESLGIEVKEDNAGKNSGGGIDESGGGMRRGGGG